MYPDSKTRMKMMEEADTLRGFLIATALSMYSEKEYIEFLTDFKMNFEWI